MSGADGILSAVEYLFSPDTPHWVKFLILAVFAVSIVGWWTRPFWHDLHTPDEKVSTRKARTPF